MVVVAVIFVADAVAVPVEEGEEDVTVSEGKAVEGCEERERGWDDEDATASAASPFF